MKIRHFISFAVAVGIFLFPNKVRSEKVCFFSDSNFNDMTYKEYSFYGDFAAAEKEFVLLSNLFDNDNDMIQCIPKGIELIYTETINDELIFNVSKEIKSFGGGCAYEICLIKQILHTVFQVDEINKVTMLIEGDLNYLPEGSIINGYSREQFEKYCK